MARFFIHRPIFAWVIAILILLVGVIALKNLPVAQSRHHRGRLCCAHGVILSSGAQRETEDDREERKFQSFKVARFQSKSAVLLKL